jgi:sugar lactone lactonase YvrE
MVLLAHAGQISREALQTLYVEPVAVAAQVAEPPTLDGKLDEKAWQAAEPLEFGFCDPTAPGKPKDTTQVRVVCDDANLYVAFDCKELHEIKAKATGDYDEKVADDDHVSILLMPRGNRWCDESHSNCLVLIKVNPKGAIWARVYRGLEGDARPGKPTTVEGLAAKAATYPNRWIAEVKIPFSGLCADAGRMEAVWKANFFRKRHSNLYDSVQPGDIGYANWTTSWKACADLATFSPSPAMFGILYVPVAKGVPDKIRALEGVAVKPPEKPPAPARDKVLPGFHLSQAELEAFFRSPVALVPLIEKGPEIRGDLSDPAWQRATSLALQYLDLFVPGEVEKNRTTVRLLSDAQYLYIGYDCEEDFMQEIRVDCDGVDPDGLWMDDCIDNLIDPGRTEDYRYYYLAVNPKCAYNKRNMKNDLTWQPPSLQVKTSRGDRGWRCEIRVAFDDLGIKPGEFPKLWGANFFRIRQARRPTMDETPGWQNFDYGWRPNYLGTGHEPELFAYLLFQKGDVVHPQLARYMAAKGMGLAALGLREQKPKVEAPAPVEEPSAPPAFARAPKVSLDGRGATIRFSAKAPTDVAVWIADEKGKIVRHLAAGVLGKKAPEPFKPDALEQTLAWDGKDDAGTEVPAGTYTVHVGLGLRAKFERTIGWKPGVGHVRSLAAGPKGELYVFTGGVSVDHGWANSGIRVFDRDGRYLRQVYPFPSSQPAEKMRGVAPIAQKDGSWLPILYNALNHSWLPECPAIETQQVALSRDGHIIMANMCMRGMGHGRRLMKLGTDGSAPPDLLGPQISRFSLGGEMYVALAPDEKTVYVTGLHGRSLYDHGEPHDVVYRVAWGEPELLDEFAKPFIGEFQTPADDPRHLSNPRGIAVDPKGNILVADFGNNRLAAFKPDGSPLKQIPLPGANKVIVHPKTGALYVLASASEEGGKNVALLKLKSLDDPSEVARLAIARWQGELVMALDAAAEPPLLWLGNGDKIADAGTAFEPKANLFKVQTGPFDPESAGFEGNLMYVDDATEQIYAGKWRVFDGTTGQFVKNLRLDKERRFDWGGEIAFGPDRLLYFAGIDGMARFDPDGNRVPFKDGPEVLKLFRGHGNSNRGHAIAPNGDVYYIHHYAHHGNTQVCVSQVAPDGTVKRYEFINNPYTSGSGIAVDRQGNVYVGMALKPRREYYPEFFQGRLPTGVACPQPWFFYRQMYGSIVKFKPEGGRVVKDAKGDYLATNYGHYHAIRIEGAEWAYHGYSPMHQKDVESSRCNCESARFDLDPFGRLFIPDAMRSSVVVIDANANEVLRFGGYGNMDARGPGSPAPKPELAFAWPLVVSATDAACYVADTVNSRILKARLEYQAAEKAEIRLR